jgi:hypothetical protein
MKTDMTALGVQLSNLQSQITRLEVSLPLTYVTRIELAERLKTVTDECDRRDKSNQEDSQRIAIFGALITGGLALLSEVFRLLGHSQ